MKTGKRVEWTISIADDCCEYAYKLRISENESIYSVYQKIRKLFRCKPVNGERRIPVSAAGFCVGMATSAVMEKLASWISDYRERLYVERVLRNCKPIPISPPVEVEMHETETPGVYCGTIPPQSDLHVNIVCKLPPIVTCKN
jgi:hypothetical protein